MTVEQPLPIQATALTPGEISKINNVQFAIHLMQYLVCLPMAIYKLYSSEYSEAAQYTSLALFAEKAFQFMNWMYYLKRGDQNSKEIYERVPKNYSFLTKMGGKVSEVVSEAVSAAASCLVNRRGR